MPAFRMMTFNLLRGGVGREDRIREVVGSIAPDVAVFTEARAGESLWAIAEVVGPHRVIGDRPFSRDSVAIVSRWPLELPRLGGPRWSPRRWPAAIVHPAEGASFGICGVHLLPHQFWPCEWWRRAEIRALLRHLQRFGGTPHIVAGDFNALAPGDRIQRDTVPRYVRAQWWVQGGSIPRWALKAMSQAGYLDAFRGCHPTQAGFTVSALNPSARIDYVFASPGLAPGLRAAGATPSDPEASDHRPVWAEFDLALPSSQPP